MPLSHSKLLSFLDKPQLKRIEIADRDGLSARVSQMGQITFQYRCRYNGKPVRISLGRFPDMTLSQAREKVPVLRGFLREGLDPRDEIKRKSTLNKAHLNDCIELFLSRHVVKLRVTTQNLYKYSLTKHAIDAFTQPVEEITVHQWFEFFDQIEDSVSSIAAQDILIRLKTCIRFCIKRGILSNSALLTISPKDVGKSSNIGDRVVTPVEIKSIWMALDLSKSYPTTKNVIKFASLSGARNTEIRNMEICDIDTSNGVWTIPAAKSKSGVKFKRAIGPQALKIINWQINSFSHVSNFVFPSGSYCQQISPQTVNKLSRAIVNRESMEHWSLHDFRRSISTILSQQGVELHVTEKMLGHSLGGMLKVYNKHDGLKEQRLAYEIWESLIAEA